jgi:molybdenum cofactor cytidylyltransferase
MRFALIPAAGKSSRMGRPKLLLPVAGVTVLELVIQALKQAGIEHILVVAGPHVPELAEVAGAAGAHRLLLSHETADMRATVEQGLAWLEDRFHPVPEDDWLLVPGDHPTLDSRVVETLLQARRSSLWALILVPTVGGRRGHPTLIGWNHVAGIRAMSAGLGINHYLREQQDATIEVPVNSEDILLDLDTPEDYERLLQGQAPNYAT